MNSSVTTSIVSPVSVPLVPSDIQSTDESTRAPQKLRRVLHVINGEFYSGAERVQDLLGLCLPQYGYEAGFACLKPVRFPVERECQDTTLQDLSMRSKLDLRAAKRLAQVAKIGGYDLLHAHSPRSLMITKIAAWLADKPFVYHVHSPTSKDSTRPIANRINQFIEQQSLRGVSQLICVSESLGKHMSAEGYDDELISVVPNGVPRRGELQPRETPTGTWTLGMVALFRPRKGTEVLIEALSILREQGVDVRLRAVGPFESEDYQNEILELSNEHGVSDAIEWTGFTNDVNAELDQMDIMVLPSLFGEGLPMVIIEAMSAGVPVVSTDVQGVPEVLNGGFGVVAKPNCAISMADCLRQVISGEVDWQEIREQAWKRQAERYSDNSMASGVAAIYDRVLDSPKLDR